MGRKVRADVIKEHWGEIPRLVASLKAGHAAPSAMLRKLAAYERQDQLAVALQEVGKIERTLFMLDWLENPAAAYTAQMYLLNARTLMQMADSMQGDAKTKARVRFAVQQWVDATSPSNFLALNPDARVILTLRDPESWYRSTLETIRSNVPTTPGAKLKSLFGRGAEADEQVDDLEDLVAAPARPKLEPVAEPAPVIEPVEINGSGRSLTNANLTGGERNAEADWGVQHPVRAWSGVGEMAQP